MFHLTEYTISTFFKKVNRYLKIVENIFKGYLPTMHPPREVGNTNSNLIITFMKILIIRLVLPSVKAIEYVHEKSRGNKSPAPQYEPNQKLVMPDLPLGQGWPIHFGLDGPIVGSGGMIGELFGDGNGDGNCQLVIGGTEGHMIA